MGDYSSILTLKRIFFEKLNLRERIKNNNELKFSLQVQIGKNKDNIYKVTLVLDGDKRKSTN